MYDIYLSVGCDKLAFAKASPGFLGLSVSGDVAAEELEQLVLAGGYGYVVPVPSAKSDREEGYAHCERSHRTKAKEVLSQL